MIEAKRRIQEIIDDADRQASQIILNAEVEARNYVAEVKERTDREAIEYARSMEALSEALISQAEVLSRESQRLLAGLGETDPGLDSSSSEFGFDDGVVATIRSAEPRIEEPADHVLEDEAVAPAQEYSAGARLLATQMAVAGSGRGDIRDRLVNDFGIDDPEPLLDSILGPA